MSEPVEYQYRTRPDWIPEWNGWNTCSKESAQAYEKTPYLHDWHYEVRRLYTTPPQRKPLTVQEMFEAIRPLYSSEKDARIAVDISEDEYRAIEAAHGIKENT